MFPCNYCYSSRVLSGSLSYIERIIWLTCRRKFTGPSLILTVGVVYPIMKLGVMGRYIEPSPIPMVGAACLNTNFGRMGRYIELQLILMVGAACLNTKYVSSRQLQAGIAQSS